MEGCNSPAALLRTVFVEPFFLRCETCHARLRVRDERFLGQVQSCPKCGSMVHIVAPAGWLAAGETAPGKPRNWSRLHRPWHHRWAPS